jgi:hypothetical protein
MLTFRFSWLPIAAILVLTVPLQARAQTLPSLGSMGSLGQLSSLLPIQGITQAPPELPSTVPPPAPAPGEAYTPGYWGYSQGGYSYVPGSWQQPPQPGAVYTPGYWGNQNGSYSWNPGYWGNQVGYYGGVPYGGGYPGTGYTGGQWSGSSFTPNMTAIQTVPTNHVGYNGGPGGIQMHPTAQQEAFAHERHIPMTAAQRDHVRESESDRNNLASVNHGRPKTLAVQRPYGDKNRPKDFKPITTADREKAPHQLNHNASANKGEQNKGKQNQGEQNKGKQNQGEQNKGKQNQGEQNKGKQNQGEQNKGKSTQGKPSQSKSTQSKPSQSKSTQSKKQTASTSHTSASKTATSKKKKPPSYL